MSCHVLSLPSFLVFIAGSALCFSHETSSGKFANRKQLNAQHVRGRLWPTFLSGANDKSASDHEIHYLSSHTGTIYIYVVITMVSQFQKASKHVITGLTSCNKSEPTKGMRTMRILAEAFRRKQQGHRSPGSSRRSYPEWAGPTNGQSESSKSVRALSICHNLTQSVTTGHSQSDIPESSSWFRLGRALPYPGDGKIKVGNAATLSRAAAILPLNSLNSSTLCSGDQDGPGLQSKQSKPHKPLTFVD